MRSFVIGAFMALFSFVPVSHADHAQVPAACVTSEAEFLASSKNLNAKIRVASDHARKVFIDYVNEARTKSGLWAFEADDLLIGLIQKDGQMLVGTVMFKDHCVVPGSVHVFAATDFIGFIVGLGLSMDDFVEMAHG